MIILLALPSGMEFIVVLMLFGILLIPGIFYLITIRNLYKRISMVNRKMPPSSVWLLLIPIFNLIWQFIVVNKVFDSMAPELINRNLPLNDLKRDYYFGLAMCILNCCLVISNFINSQLNIFIFIGALVCWIFYWIKIGGYKTILETENPIAS
jgi:hypothetical protein